jgi:type II secretion system protein G
MAISWYAVRMGLAKKLRNKRSGFTLIELLIVIAIIGLLASVVLVAVNNARSKGRSAKRVSDIRALQKALELYYSDNGSYPVSNSFVFDCYLPTASYNNYIPGMAPYVANLPHDPASHCGGTQDYNYAYRSNGVDYKLLVPVVPNKSNGIENCSLAQEYNVLDPVRPCAGGDPAWAVYTAGAANW